MATVETSSSRVEAADIHSRDGPEYAVSSSAAVRTITRNENRPQLAGTWTMDMPDSILLLKGPAKKR